MEEFTNKNDVGLDKDVILESEKKITLQPVHDDVQMDDESDIQIAASHANGTPIANIASDRESTNIDGAETPQPTSAAMRLQPQPTHVTPRRSHNASIVIMGIIIVILLFVLLYR